MNFNMIDNKTVRITGVENFNLTHTFMCGQCFRWHKNADGSFSGVAMGRAAKMSLDGDVLEICGATVSDIKLWLDYLDLNRDYGAVKKRLSGDPYVKRAIEFSGGIHILNQDIFECLISYIISAQNQIPRISKTVDELSRLYGSKCCIGGEEMYAFPTPQQLKDVTEDDFHKLKTGYRAPYLKDAVSRVLNGNTDLEKIKSLPYSEARAELLKIKGVGPKVADCILLFSARRSQAFPVDVWVQRTMRTLYLDDSATNRMIEKKAAELFGEYAGFAQQYLFYYARENGGIEKM